jgi:hypothetical protein
MSSKSITIRQVCKHINNLMPRHYCWWCKELFEEGEVRHYKSGWLCDRCKAYLESQSGNKEMPDAG